MYKASWTNSPLYQTHQAQLLLIPEGWFSVPCQSVELFKQTSHILLQEPGGAVLCGHYKVCLPQPVPEYSPQGALLNLQCPSPVL